MQQPNSIPSTNPEKLPANQKYYRPYERYSGPLPPEPKFRPYESDEESDQESSPSDYESGSVSTTTSSRENLPNFVEFATNLELNKAGGQNFPTTEAQLKYGVNQIRKDTGYASYKEAFNICLPFDSKLYDTSGNDIWGNTNQGKQPTTSIVMLNSRDRDRNVYPTPANLTLRLPRVYHNITSMQIVQMKLLSSFLYFRADKNNICMTINEFGRIFYNYFNFPNAINQGPLNVKKCIRSGTYNINSLIQELNTQLNTPPLFYDYPGGFNQFVPLFVSTGDFSIVFNYPGDYFYDSLNQQYVAAPTRSYITRRFWSTLTLGFTPNLTQTKVAYYYPVLREYVVDPEYGIGKLNTNINTSALLPGETIYSRIVYAFQGVNDPIIQQLIDLNVNQLDIYRSAHTFRQGLVNRYVVSYETFNNRIFIQSPSLNTSLVNLLNTQYAIFLAQQLAANNLTAQQYTNLQTLNSQLLSIINAMYDFIQTQMALFFGINFNTFAPIYFTQPNNYINIQNAVNAIGVSSNYDFNVIQNNTPAITSNVIEINRQDPTIYWPNMSNLPVDPVLGMKGYPENLGPAFLNSPGLTSNYPYEISIDDFEFTKNFIDTDGDIYTDIRRKAGDIICPIDSSRYTVFKFRSLYRQTLQVETMPRPTQYRYPAYNAITYGSNIVNVFDNSYSFVFNSSNANMDNIPFGSLNTIYGFSNPSVYSNPNFGISLTGSKALWGTNTISLDVRTNSYNFVFYLPWPTAPTPTTPAYKHTMGLTVLNYAGINIPSALKVFLYQDRAAFMADLSGNARNENPLHYKASYDIGTNDISGTVSWTAYAGQTYYAVVRSASISFQSFQAQVVLWYPEGSAYTSLSSSLVGFDPFANPSSNLSNFNYAETNDPDFIKLPTASNLWGINPIGNEVNRGLVISNVPIGYDTNGVSTDLTDYVGFVPNISSSNLLPNALIRADPISGYFFQAGSPYNPNTQNYFYSGASNFLLTPINQSNYTASNVLERQYKIVHWYNTTYIPDPAGFTNPLNPAVDVSPNITPYKLSNTFNVPISNYDYDIVSSNIQLGLGCCGFSFAPGDGLWLLDKVMFRSALTSIDYNSNIKYLGIFLTNVVNTTPINLISLGTAVAKLNFTKKTTYSNAGNINFGFDGLLGTYYEFDKDTGFQQSVMTGFDQNAAVLTNNANNFYSVIPFDENSNVVYMRALTGSLTTYPYVCDASASRFYFDGQSAPNRKGIVMPSNAPPAGSVYGPPPGVSYTLSAYEQSLPIGTPILHYLSQTNLAEDLSGFIPWSGPGYVPTQIYADVSGTMMIQSTDFKFYSYPYNSTNRTFTYEFNLTVDSIYPPAEATTLVGAAGNSTCYAFLGFQVVGGAYQLRIKLYDVGLGTLFDVGVPVVFQIPDLGFSLKSFSYTDAGGFVLAGTSGTGSAIVYRTPSVSAPGFFIDTYPPGYTSVKAVQPPTSDIVYSLPFFASGLSSTIYYSINEALPSTGINRNINTIDLGTTGTIPSYYNNIAVSRVPGIGDQVLFLSPQDLAPALLNAASRFYTLRQLTGTAPNYSARVEYSDLVFRTLPPAANPMVPLNLVGGALGSKWAFFNQQAYIWGNRNDNADAPVLVQNAWQMFYPTTKIVLRKLANAVNPITDLSGLEYPEFPHTQMFAYNTKQAYLADISASKWGFETSGGLLPTNVYNLNSNGFLVSDVNFSGFYFNSYIFNVPLLPTGGSNPEQFYYLVVRNYTPSEKSQVLLRFNLPQRYDFGFVRIRDLSNEPLLLPTQADKFNPSYFTALSNFNYAFNSSNPNWPTTPFGYNPSQNIPGSNIISAGFGDFVNQYTKLFNTYTSNVQIINTISSNVNQSIQTFINENLTYILPDYAKTRENFTEAITFSILWRSALTPLYLKAEDEWGLGWNLGYAKEDTPYATIQKATSFFKILDDYIYLKLNTEYDMNRMDFGGKENLKETNEPTGSILGYNGKLLLNTFGSYAQTIIQNPVYFNPPLMKLDKLTFQWYDIVGQIITNTECEWNAAIQIVEEYPKADLRGKNPVIIPPPIGSSSSDFQDTSQNVRFFPS